MNLVLNFSNGICVCICSVKCEASHKKHCNSRLFNACHLQIEKVGTYRLLDLSICSKLQDQILVT